MPVSTLGISIIEVNAALARDDVRAAILDFLADHPEGVVPNESADALAAFQADLSPGSRVTALATAARSLGWSNAPLPSRAGGYVMGIIPPKGWSNRFPPAPKPEPVATPAPKPKAKQIRKPAPRKSPVRPPAWSMPAFVPMEIDLDNPPAGVMTQIAQGRKIAEDPAFVASLLHVFRGRSMVRTDELLRAIGCTDPSKPLRVERYAIASALKSRGFVRDYVYRSKSRRGMSVYLRISTTSA